MADTIREKILDNIKTTLELINGTGAYVNNILSVQRFKQAGNDYAITPCVIIIAGQETLEKRSGFYTRAKLQIGLALVHIAPSDTDTVLNSLLGDIQNALMADYTRGSLAENTTIQTIVPYDSMQGEPYTGLIITVEIQYIFKTNDPSS